MDALHPWMDRLSEYVDDELPPAEREALESHLAVCGACRETLDGLRAVVAKAARLEDRAPESDLWPEIRRRVVAEGAGTASGTTSVLEPGRRRAPRGWRLSLSLPQLAAAAIAMMLLSGGGVWLALSGGAAPGAPGPAVSGPAVPGSAGRSTMLAADPWVPAYQSAVSDLERVLVEGRDRLDPGTVRVLEENLLIIDRAIEEARRAVLADPANVYLNNHLAESMRRKLELLRRANDIVRARS